MTQLGKMCLTLGLVMAVVGCDVNKTQEGEMPEVSVEGGQMPKYDVDTPDVDIEMEKREIEVPAVNIDEADSDDDLQD